MSWIFITIIAYFFHALNAVTDKFLLSERIPRPSIYAFYVGIFGLGALVLIPFGDFFIPNNLEIIKALVSGAAFTFALFLFFTAMKYGEASRVSTIIGGASPIFVLLLSYFFLGSFLSQKEFTAFLVLILGSALIAFEKLRPKSKGWGSIKIIGLAILSAFIFAVSYVFAKAVFNELPFINGFIWTRFGSFAAAILFLIPRDVRQSIFRLPAMAEKSTIVIFLINKLFGVLGFFILYYAIFLGNVSLINAMQGIEYALIFIIILFLSFRYPAILKEDISTKIVLQKSVAIILIGIGLFILV